jgi:protein-tyrosine phosphatase
MIYHETVPDSPAVVVMLTQTHESGKEKCFQYYPHSMEAPTMTLNEQDEFQDGFLATLTLVKLTMDERTKSEIRELELKVKDDPSPRKVWHFLFAGWPDFLVPEDEDRAALIELVRLTAEKNENNEVPRIVHCSAGVGRSGTFIALDWLLGELDEGTFDQGDVVVNEERDPIAEVVDELRQQRMMMVQGEPQFQFLYDVIKELWTQRLKAKQSNAAPSES